METKLKIAAGAQLVHFRFRRHGQHRSSYKRSRVATNLSKQLVDDVDVVASRIQDLPHNVFVSCSAGLQLIVEAGQARYARLLNNMRLRFDNVDFGRLENLRCADRRHHYSFDDVIKFQGIAKYYKLGKNC